MASVYENWLTVLFTPLRIAGWSQGRLAAWLTEQRRVGDENAAENANKCGWNCDLHSVSLSFDKCSVYTVWKLHFIVYIIYYILYSIYYIVYSALGTRYFYGMNISIE